MMFPKFQAQFEKKISMIFIKMIFLAETVKLVSVETIEIFNNKLGFKFLINLNQKGKNVISLYSYLKTLIF